ncbi:HVO_2922 family protein [Haloplanus sp. C73]|uniref:HVO_2922 family protein n=1 Tax=Haloplanus sp. C73 TaxID=3421641 RepID=UPI003EB7EFEC
MAAQPVFELYEDRGSEWRWRLVASNGNIVADSAEGYASKQGAKRGIDCVKRIAPDADVEER